MSQTLRRDCRDAFLEAMRTVANFGTTFWDYLGGLSASLTS